MLAALPLGARAQEPATQNEQAAGGRVFPPGTLRGRLVIGTPPEVRLDGESARLAPGARIHGPQRMLVMPASVAGQELAVNYTRDSSGLLREVWILTPGETQARRASAERPLLDFWPFVARKGPQDDGKTPFDQLPRYGE